MHNLELNKKTHSKRWDINDFLIFLESKKICLCKYSEDADTVFTRTPITQGELTCLLDEHFGIDSEELEKERQELLRNAKENMQNRPE